VLEIEKNILWQGFAQKNSLSKLELEQFQTYAQLLIAWNERINLTALTDVRDIIEHHFQDSLNVMKVVNLSDRVMIADVGTGAGFPAIPLKIMNPHVPFVLIEVNNKKIAFLQEVAARLGLSQIEYITDDWRTFLRHTALPIDLFLARASLQPEELLRIFKGQSFYKKATLVYWASQHWQPESHVAQYIDNDCEYSVGGKKRRYIIFSQKRLS
jgi:16S rRNA (guanine(527)-N(7))-methyltransferase RsmG